MAVSPTNKGWRLSQQNGLLAALYRGAQPQATTLAANTADSRGILIGTPVSPALAVDSIVISNAVASGDYLLALNRGGNSEAWEWVDASAGLMTLYGRGVSAMEVGLNMVINEGSADRDFRIEGDNNANMLVIDAGTDTEALGRAVVAGAFLSVDGSAVDRTQVTQVGTDIHLPAATINDNGAAATKAIWGRGVVRTPTLTSTNAITYSDAATLYIQANPTASTNVTITRGMAVWVDDGDTRLDGDVSVGATKVSGAGITVANTAARTLVTQVGGQIHIPAQTVNDAGVAATKAILGTVVFRTPTHTSTNAITYTDAATLYVQAQPTASTNVTISTGWAAWFDAGDLRLDGDLYMNDSAARDIRIVAETNAALEISNGTTKILTFDTRTTTDGIAMTAFRPLANTVPEATAHPIGIQVVAVTHVISKTSGSNVITSGSGVQMSIQGATLQANANTTTTTTLSTVYIAKSVAGTNHTITNNRIIDTDAVAYLSAAGVWTDNACTVEIKEAIADMTYADLQEAMKPIRPVNFDYKSTHMPGGTGRHGIIAEELPEFLVDTGQADRHSVGSIYLAAFNLAATKLLYEEIETLKKQLRGKV